MISNLITFCTFGPDNKVYKDKDAIGNPSAKVNINTSNSDLLKTYPNSNLDICGCFMPTDYSIAKDYNKLIENGMTLKDATEFTNLMIAANAYQIPGCYDIKCANNAVNRQSWINAPGGCRAIQICMNKAVINNAGKITGNVNISQSNNCETKTDSGTGLTTGTGTGLKTGTSTGSITSTGTGSITGTSTGSITGTGTGSITGTTTGTTTGSTTGTSNKTLYIVIAVVVLLVILGGLGIFFIK